MEKGVPAPTAMANCIPGVIKEGTSRRILDLFVRFGADENILYEAHPHIGTNKLPAIISAIRHYILSCGGEIHFHKKLNDGQKTGKKSLRYKLKTGTVSGQMPLSWPPGHSARDIYHLLHRKNKEIHAKPFAFGVRVEHPQELINSIQYHYIREEGPRVAGLPPAAYQLVHTENNRSVFSFCMCPGGIIAPASTQRRAGRERMVSFQTK